MNIFNFFLIATTARHNTNLFNLLYQGVIMRGRIPSQQTIEEGVINYHITDNPLLFTSSVEGDITAIRKFKLISSSITIILNMIALLYSL